MRFLKKLSLQGYKTFASRTEFEFDRGVTAIVGPNGSGKSNIADSLRWVLGEQSYGSLRGKRTEDMIFSGSEQRARLGMAQVTLTFDNATQWLPIDFAEVEISRRAYRSGENEYFLNGNKVRLKDIAELLGSSGLSERNYTVIGQGLIDQALSQRPEGRRRLFEEAAGITVHQSKRDQAAQKLSDANANLTRAKDIISELTPRLRYLKGQARRASEYQQVKTDLDALLGTWYGFRWQQGLAALAEARTRVSGDVTRSEQQSGALTELLNRMGAIRDARAQLREELGEWHRQSSVLHRQAESVQRDLAVRTEQLRLWGEQRVELEREVVHLRAALEDGAQRVGAAEEEYTAAKAAHDERAATVAVAQQALNVREQERQVLARRVTQSQDHVLDLKAQLAARRSRLAQAGEQREELRRTQGSEAKAADEAAQQLVTLENQIRALSEEVGAVEAEIASIDRTRQAKAAELAAAQERERKVVESLSTLQRALSRLQDQHDMLSRLRDEGAGMGSGPRAVLSAARRTQSTRDQKGAPGAGQLDGIVGALGELIEVPPELDKAIEAAMGSRLQDIVVQRWEDAETAVSFLKQNRVGRATFLPLDSLRPGRAADVPRMAGVLGLASELVKFDSSIGPAVDLALNRTLVVQDLPTARRLLRSDTHATLVTIDGEIVRPGGSVTGGADNSRRDSGVLARARELREMPDRIAAARREVAAGEGQLAAAQAEQNGLRDEMSSLRRRRDELTAKMQSTQAERNRTQLAADRAKQTAVWHKERGGKVGDELHQLDRKEADLQEKIAELDAAIAEGEAQTAQHQRELSEHSTTEEVQELARLRAEAAVSAGRLESYRARLEELRTLQRERAREIDGKGERIGGLAAQEQAAREAITQQGEVGQRLATEINDLSAEIDPAEAQLASLEQQQRKAEAEERALREQLRTMQMRQSQGELGLQRARDELTHLREEIEKELGIVAISGDDLGDDQPPLPISGVVTQLPVVTELPDGLEQDVRALRAQVSRLGPVNLDAVSEYAEVEARYNFLTEQSRDLEQAVASLEQVIRELDQLMVREFLTTFQSIASRFREEFTNLFGGGSAKLILTEPDSPTTTGVEIVARPPGKREQGLALLSGGERALTAAALIFSILKTSPTPFCVLDEVDAALDEANVGRFRDALKALSDETQFILITHNRGTIEAADTIYGISMGVDNTSQVLSLRLDGREVVPADRVPQEV